MMNGTDANLACLYNCCSRMVNDAEKYPMDGAYVHRYVRLATSLTNERGEWRRPKFDVSIASNCGVNAVND